MKKATGQPMDYDEEMAETVIGEILNDDLSQYDIVVGEAVASDTIKMANNADLREFSQMYPGLVPPDILIEESDLAATTKTRLLNAMAQMAEQQRQQQAAVANAAAGAPPSPGAPALDGLQNIAE
jgi:hypothetical protein